MNINSLIPGCKYFFWKEALYLPKIDDYHIPNEYEIENIISLAVKLEIVRNFIAKPFSINCWIRPIKVNSKRNFGINYNQLVNGAENSLHIMGLAVDGFFKNSDIDSDIESIEKKLNIFELSMERNGSKVNRNWIHLQNSKMKDGKYRAFLP